MTKIRGTPCNALWDVFACILQKRNSLLSRRDSGPWPSEMSSDRRVQRSPLEVRIFNLRPLSRWPPESYFLCFDIVHNITWYLNPSHIQSALLLVVHWRDKESKILILLMLLGAVQDCGHVSSGIGRELRKFAHFIHFCLTVSDSNILTSWQSHCPYEHYFCVKTHDYHNLTGFIYDAVQNEMWSELWSVNQGRGTFFKPYGT